MSSTQQQGPDPLREDFRVFLTMCWYFLGLPKPTPKQLRIAEFLQHGPRRRMVMAFRGLGKSWITAAYVLWRLYCKPTENILVVSASSKRSEEFAQFCHKLIMEWEVLSHLRPGKGQRFSMNAFDVGPAGISHQPSVKAEGINGQITGSRADLIVADDVEVPGNSDTPLMREKISEKIKEFSAIIKPGGEIAYLGTPQTEQSIYNQLPDRGYEILVIPARVPKQADLPAYGGSLESSVLELAQDPANVGKPTDPDRFTDFELTERELEYGRSGFALQFMLNTRLSDLEKYPLKITDLVVMSLNREKGPDKVVWSNDPALAWKDLSCVGLQGDRYYRNIPQEDTHWVPWESSIMAIDPSGRGKDETAVVVVKSIGPTLFLTRIQGFLGGFEEDTLEAIAKVAHEEGVQRILIEENFGGGMFEQLFKPVLKKFHTCMVEPVRHSIQKERRICDVLEPLMNQHRLVIDKKAVEYDFDSTRKRPIEAHNRYRLLWQMPRITRDRGALPTDDRLDCLAMACEHYVSRMAVSVDDSVKQRQEELREKDFEFYMQNSVGDNWKLDKPSRHARAGFRDPRIQKGPRRSSAPIFPKGTP